MPTNPTGSSIDLKENSVKNIWDKSVKVEQSSYYWNTAPVLTAGKTTNDKKPFIVELFCGCGGTSVGFEMAGFKVALGCDILTPAITTFQYNHPAIIKN